MSCAIFSEKCNRSIKSSRNVQIDPQTLKTWVLSVATKVLFLSWTKCFFWCNVRSSGFLGPFEMCPMILCTGLILICYWNKKQVFENNWSLWMFDSFLLNQGFLNNLRLLWKMQTATGRFFRQIHPVRLDLVAHLWTWGFKPLEELWCWECWAFDSLVVLFVVCLFLGWFLRMPR